MVAHVSHNHASIATYADSPRIEKLGLSAFAIFDATQAASRHGGDKALGRDAPDAVVTHVRHEHDAISCDGNCDWIVELSLVARPVLVALHPPAGQGGDHPLRCDLADAMVARVGHEQIPVTIQRDSVRLVELGLVAHAVLKAAHPAAVLRHHLPLGCHLVDTMHPRVDDYQVAIAIDYDSHRTKKMSIRFVIAEFVTSSSIAFRLGSATPHPKRFNVVRI
mmetsp:Transcript_41248/g.69032  ORF Transcript_41248/g.69032 Transcript_41248/m.69032 type:complete len:221 (-) Transcript_41248:336-998(-)